MTGRDDGGAGEADEVVVTLEMGDIVTGEIEVPVGLRARQPILLVDDDEALARMLGILFRKHGFDVTVAEDGMEGYQAALAAPFEAVVADLNMPRRDGWGLLRVLRDDYRTRELPVAFLSAHDDYRESLRALDAGAQAYLSKSTRLEALAAHVRSLLEPRRQAKVALSSRGPVAIPVGALGPQWVVRQCAALRLTGILEGADDWAGYRLTFSGGQPVHAVAQSGRHVAEREKAFTAFIASRGVQGRFVPQAVSVEPNLQRDTEALIAHAIEVLSTNQGRVRESLKVHATRIDVNPDLYALYTQIGPAGWLETARLICEERLPPREIIARASASPLEVEETLKDLVRRGVVTLSA